MNENDDERSHLGDLHFTTELIDVAPNNARVTSIVTSKRASTGTGGSGASAAAGAGAGAAGAAAGAGGVSGEVRAENNQASKIITPSPAPGTKGGRGNTSSAVHYTLYRTTPSDVWWPVSLLRAVIEPADGGGEGVAVHTLNTRTGASSSPAKAERIGFLWCGYNCMQLELAPSVSGLLYTCEECEAGVVSVSWQDVSAFVVLYVYDVCLVPSAFKH
jgi:hypothetical protein